MKVHSKGMGYGSDCEFVYVDDEGNFIVASCIDFIPCPVRFTNIPYFLIHRSEDDAEFTDIDPDTKYECLGEL